ncbi:hypothetical protein MLD63_07085 [Paracoccus sp. TK19116]|uniref:Uncharacterized protein n=1 Tax=Paracoccus albicereus TaxID=2922394 RepID=A0ABT1MPG6_9RHOB|nr:hypothetical protein [Paracoccus albicereus]MCQ0970182.1 hypothetical protein [Paracoccus albicereus]
MWNWVGEHTDVLQVIVGVVTALVWVVYLHILIEGMRRQRRSEILITLGGKRDLGGRILISNLGLEPIYVLDILLRISGDRRVRTVSIAERRDGPPIEDDPSDTHTLQTPLKTGDSTDIGEIYTLLHRADPHTDRPADAMNIEELELTVVAVTAATSSVVAAKRGFAVMTQDGDTVLRPKGLYARQIRNRWARRSIEREMEKNL